jgi:hypothetical protein
VPLVLLSLVLLASPRPVVAVVDVSRPDAVYEDVSRALAADVAAALGKVGLDASRVEEDELPQEGCRAGPCLEVVARARAAQALVLLDANEKGSVIEVSVMALRGSDGRPLAAKRYVSGASATKALARFARDLARSLGAADGGR